MACLCIQWDSSILDINGLEEVSLLVRCPHIFRTYKISIGGGKM